MAKAPPADSPAQAPKRKRHLPLALVLVGGITLLILLAAGSVLYISLRKPQRASDSEMRDDGVIVHRHGKRIVGLTILDASSR